MNQKLLSVAKGETPADLVIRNGKVVNVYSGEIYDGGVGNLRRHHRRRGRCGILHR